MNGETSLPPNILQEMTAPAERPAFKTNRIPVVINAIVISWVRVLLILVITILVIWPFTLWRILLEDAFLQSLLCEASSVKALTVSIPAMLA